jgi:uncharacterized protein (DUF1810 family)
MSDMYNLQRFIDAQQLAYDRALGEIQRGQKQSHWMWFIFPQIAGLGTSDKSRFYAISGLPEAKAYLSHPQLGPRLRMCAHAICNLRGRSIHGVLGSPDDDKLQSSMTLFALATEYRTDFLAIIKTHYDNRPDRKTIKILQEMKQI